MTANCKATCVVEANQRGWGEQFSPTITLPIALFYVLIGEDISFSMMLGSVIELRN